MKSRVILSVLLGQAAALVLGVVAGCGDDSPDTTGGRRVVLKTRVELAEGEAEGFVTLAGWSVELGQVLLSTGTFRYFDGVPPIDTAWFGRFVGVRTARAHPGHYVQGTALGEMLVPFSVDLLAGPAEYPAGEGVTGQYRSASFSYRAPPEGPLAEALDGHVAVVGGVARRKEQEPRYFLALADLPDVESVAPGGAIDGCVLEAGSVDGDGTITVTVRPSVWLKLVDFSELEPGQPEAPARFEPGTQPQVAFSQGLAELSAYRFSFARQLEAG